MPARDATLEDLTAEWRSVLERRRLIPSSDADVLEDHLRQEATALADSGLEPDEAFLVALKRIGIRNRAIRAVALDHITRVLTYTTAPDIPARSTGIETVVVVSLAILAALAIKVPVPFGVEFAADPDIFYPLNLSLFVLPFLAVYFVWQRRTPPLRWLQLGLPFAAAAAIVNGFPFEPDGDTAALAILHLPIALWIVIGVAHAGGDWSSHARRMDFVRFSGELAVFYVLTAIGGGLLVGITLAMFSAIGLNAARLVEAWILPCGALGAVIVGAWLVEIRRNVVEQVVPLLTRVFTPLFAIVLLTFLSTMMWTGRGIAVERGVLIAFDLLLVMVLGLLLYAVTARHAESPPNAFDALQLLLIVSALLVDALALAAIAARISEFGFTPNRVAALGENLILFVNLAWSAWLYLRYLRAQCEFSALQRWQTAYLPVYAVWAGLVVAAFPPLFGYR